MKVLIGVDPHKGSVAVAAIDEATGELLERAGFSQDRSGLRALESWAKRFSERRWAVENAGTLGRYLAGRLTTAGESVVDVPPKLSARVRVLSSFAGNARKNDGVDAPATALAASRTGRLAPVEPESESEVLRLVSEWREDLVAERTRALNRLHGLLRDLVPGGVAGTLSADRAARVLRGMTVGSVARFPSRGHFASYSGTAPVEASSGEVVRHRLSLAGNRHLNYALHMVAVCQARSDARGGTYYRKKKIEQLAERLGEDAYSEVLPAEDSGERRPWEWACLGLAADPKKGMSRWLLVRRGSDDPEDIAFYQAYGPEDTSVEELVRVCQERWAIEFAFEEAKGEIGMDHYEVRKW